MYENVEMRNNFFIDAAQKGDDIAVKLLLENGADVNVKNAASAK